MNYDDEFTREFEEEFQKNLKIVKNFSIEEMQRFEEHLSFLNDFVEDFDDNPNNSMEDIEFYNKLTVDLPLFTQILEHMRLILDESLYRKSKAYFEHIKKLAKEGNKSAEEIYLDLKSDFENFDVN